MYVDSETILFCEDKLFGGIKCPQGSSGGIVIESAEYGRSDTITCPFAVVAAMLTTDCQQAGTMLRFQDQWEGKSEVFDISKISPSMY